MGGMSELHKEGCQRETGRWSFQVEDIDDERFRAWFECRGCGATTPVQELKRDDSEEEGAA